MPDPSDQVPSVTQGDYSGAQLHTTWRATDRLRLSARGNRASTTESTTPVRVPGAILNTVTVTQPGDRPLQADLVATWPISSQLDVTV